MNYEQLPNESTKAFEAFKAYVNLAPEERSIREAAKALGKSAGVLERWSKKFGWQERLQAYVGTITAVERQTAEQEARAKAAEWVRRQDEQRELEWEKRTMLIELADEMIRRWQANPHKFGTLEGIARLLDLACKLGRLSSGMATDRTESSTEVAVTVDVEWEAALRKVYGQTGVAAPPASWGAGAPAGTVLDVQSTVVEPKKIAEVDSDK